jgi:outer membrane immunogenic protein
MRKAFFAGCAVLATMNTASAADLPFKAPAPMPIASVAGWSGFYIGLGGGGASANKTFDYNDLTVAAPFLWNSAIPASGAFGGGQIGFNWQAGWVVLGLEADAFGGDINGHGICNTTTFFLNCATKSDAFGTVTGRLGGAVDHALLYVKGGGAWIRDAFTISNVALPPLATAFTSRLSDTRTGWTVGVGVEYAFTPCWSAKFEYDYMDFGTKRYNFPQTSAVISAATFTNWDIDQRMQTVKVGLNYRFNWAGPVVARY